jgi:hypothetical protein
VGEPDADLPPPAEAVAVAYVNSNEVTYSWHHSMIELIGWDLANHARVVQGGYIAMRAGTNGLVEARNLAVKQFLNEGKADWLFWIDTDMGFAPDTVDRLFAVADPAHRPVVGGLCFTQQETTSDDMGGWHTAASPTVFDWTTAGDEQGFAARTDYPRDSLVRCSGTGSACVLIHRSAFEKVATNFGPVWYDRLPNPSMGRLFGEDLSFCVRLGALDIPVFVHTGVKTTHQKLQWVGEAVYVAQRALQRPVAAPPATEEVAVIVPVVGRPQNAEPFMRSLRASTGLAHVYAMADQADQASVDAWRDAGAVVIAGPFDAERPGSFAEKVNFGYRETGGPIGGGWRSEPWLFLVGDDVRFHPGWLDHAQAAASDGVHVIGTNDLGNPRVTTGEHATHLLIRRSYVDEVGASWDGPKTVCHEGYRHWFVDDEIVTAAKQRGVWAMAKDSVVEHLHPAWGKGKTDAVYKLGQSYAAEDKKLFEKRLAAHG